MTWHASPLSLYYLLYLPTLCLSLPSQWPKLTFQGIGHFAVQLDQLTQLSQLDKFPFYLPEDLPYVFPITDRQAFFIELPYH